jgi:hypothetical protein
MSKRRLVRALWGMAAALALLGAGCGGSADGSPSAESQTTKAALVESSQTYRDQLAVGVSGPDDARRNFHDAPIGELTLASARQLARASRAAAREIDELTPAAGLDDLNDELAENTAGGQRLSTVRCTASPSRPRGSATSCASTEKPPTSYTSKSL